MISALTVHDHLWWLIIAVSVMFTGKKLELSRTIKNEPPAEPSFKVRI